MGEKIENTLIIGGGTAGMAAAIELRKRGIAVDLLEIDDRWHPDGAGISVNGAMMRAMDTLGILDDFLREGFAGDGTAIMSHRGDYLSTAPTPRLARPDVPAIGGIMRATLARIMASKVRETGTRVFLGQTYSRISEDAEGVDVEFSDRQSERYDLVIISDGLFSKTRDMLFPHAPKPQYVGQTVWRAVLPRPETIKSTTIWMGIKGVKPGTTPISKTHLYLFVTEDVPEKKHVAPETMLSKLKALLEPFSCPVVQTFRSQLSGDSQIVYRPLDSMLMRDPWHRGRLVMIGDVVHGTTPQLTAGAMMGIEDAIVLAQEIEAGGTIEAILNRFFARRFDRCRLVVENSGRLSQIEIEGGSKDEYEGIMRSSAIALARPI